ncbi:helix-turn-helix domain-containing protein, partial [Yersinia aldovae]
FRADLLDRLAFDVVQLPPLRERRQDIMLLAEHFAMQMCRELSLPLFPGFTPQARDQLLDYHWPGNVRELKNVVERSVYRHGNSDQSLDNIIINPFAPRQLHENTAPQMAGTHVTELPQLPLDLKQWLHNSEQQMVEHALKQARFNQRKAASLLGLTYHQLRGMLKKHAILTNDDVQ